MRKTTKTETATPIEAELVRDNIDAPEFEIVRTVKTGRPLFLTPKRFVRICKLIEQGESASEACRQQLVTYARFRFHVQRNEKYQRRLKQAEEVREKYLYEFHMANVKKHAPRNVISSLWWLERRFPERFALRSVHRVEGQEQRMIGDRISEDDLRKYAEQYALFQKENVTLSSPEGETSK